MFGTGLQFSTHELIDLRFGFILPKTKCRLTVVAIYDVALTAARCIDAVKNSHKKAPHHYEAASRIVIMLNIPFIRPRFLIHGSLATDVTAQRLVSACLPTLSTAAASGNPFLPA
jgi:hypothetical protein